MDSEKQTPAPTTEGLHGRALFDEIPRPRIIRVNDRMQQGYEYELVEPEGRNFDPCFKPDLTPIEMLELGIFGGRYMNDCLAEFPDRWFKNAKLSVERNEELNCFGVNASKSLTYWRERGWIHPEDPRGWFQWYCRYYMGRRGSDDFRQVKRWAAMKRHLSQLTKHCRPGDLDCRRRQRQALLHWAYDTRKV